MLAVQLTRQAMVHDITIIQILLKDIMIAQILLRISNIVCCNAYIVYQDHIIRKYNFVFL